MSALAVLFHRDHRPVNQTDIWAMLDVVPYRGPDGMTVRSIDSVAFGHAKMAVTPEEIDEQQPLVSLRSGCMLIADVRLDNRDDLLRTLPDRPSSSASDSELILRAYEAWGIDAPKHLLGDFAFVIWDPRQERVLCARDTHGQRALFYRVNEHTFAAGSEIHQLLQDPTVPLAPNEERIRNHLVPVNAYRIEKDQAETFYQGIYSVPAAHLLIIDRESVRVERYWELLPQAELRYRTEDEYAEHYRTLLFDVVRTRLRTAHPIGVLLSGGLDSSSITCVAQDLYRAGQATDSGFISFSSVFDGMECDERDFIEDIRAKYDFEAHYIPRTRRAGWLRFDPSGFQESPNIGVPEARNVTMEKVSKAGVRVLLTGEIADSCVGGWPLVFDSVLRRGHLRDVYRRVQAYRKTSDESLRRTLGIHTLVPLLPLAVQRPLLSRDAERRVRRIGNRLMPFWMPASLREDLTRRHLALLIRSERERRFANPARHMEHQLLSPPEITRHPTPWSIESWRPFADRRIHEFMLAIPPEVKYAPHPNSDEYYAGSKRVVRQAMRGIVPESIRTRTNKTHFEEAYTNTMKAQWPLLEATFGPSTTSWVAERGYVDGPLFWHRLELLRDGLDGADLAFIASILSIETWLRALSLPRSQAVQVPLATSPDPLPVPASSSTLAGTTARAP